MMTVIQTKHSTVDRIDRMMMIAQNFGWGDPLVSHPSNVNPRHTEIVTTTGICLVKEGNRLITAFPLTVPKAYAIYSNMGLRLPSTLKNRILKNRKVLKEIGWED